MASVTIEIPDRIFEIIKQRAQDTKSTPEAVIATNIALLFGPCIYDRSKWLKNMPNPDDYSVPWG
ncbi:MAG TPA: hypothetical protein VI935_10915 [Thermodesulfobacteriota bacterium]|nr:hypothetical protein [Thermodesulfobacteriota bacterium]HZX12783.1 hypothetical protein [Thermodesulfobacteriota bacterium]